MNENIYGLNSEKKITAEMAVIHLSVFQTDS